MYENKQKDGNLVEEKGDISTQRNNNLHKSTGILLKPSIFFAFGALGNEPSASKCGNSRPPALPGDTYVCPCGPVELLSNRRRSEISRLLVDSVTDGGASYNNAELL